MKCFYYLVLFCSILLLCRISWFAYQYGIGKAGNLPGNCECDCTDSKPFVHDLQTSIHYSGPRTTAGCGCDEFLLPRIQDFAHHMDLKALCEVCDCSYARESDFVFELTYMELFDLLILGFFCWASVVLVWRWLHFMRQDLSQQTADQRRALRIHRALRVLEKFYSDNVGKAKEFLGSSATPSVNNDDAPKSQDQQNYKTFYTEI